MKKVLLAFCMVFAGCANLPPSIKNAPSQDIPYQDALKQSSHYEGSTVRWGGTIIDVENNEDASWIQVLHYPLRHYGRPNLRKPTAGRFVIKANKFLDPAIYTQGKSVTVSGTLNGNTDRKIGNKTVQVPVVNVGTAHLWRDTYRGYAGYGYRGFGYYPYAWGFYPYGFYRRPFFYRRGFYACY